jgi:hypothetical protein
MSNLQLPINYEFLLMDHNKKHKFTVSICGNTIEEIIDNANKLGRELFELYTKDYGVNITDKVTFQNGEEVHK